MPRFPNKIGKYTDIVRLVNVRDGEDIELGQNEELIEMKLHENIAGLHCKNNGSWVVLHVREYLKN